MIYIKIKYIKHEVIGDAPFIGALIVANDCNKNCKNCFNQELKDIESIDCTWHKIRDITKENKLNEGIILGGLEWTEQPNDMINLMLLADNDFKVMLYTGISERDFLSIPDVEELLNYKKPIYIKYGAYDINNITDDNYHFGIKLASSNQYIKYYGDDLIGYDRQTKRNTKNS